MSMKQEIKGTGNVVDGKCGSRAYTLFFFINNYKIISYVLSALD